MNHHEPVDTPPPAPITGGVGGVPIRVAFDHQIFAIQRHGGISRYYSRLLEQLPAHGIDARAIAPLYVNAYVAESDTARVIGCRIADGRIMRRIARDVDNLFQRPLTRWYDPRIVHETYYTTKRRAPTRSRTVLTVYDMIHEHFPDQFPADDGTIARKAAAIARADHILCISESTRNDLIAIYPDTAMRSSVTLLGFDRPPPCIDIKVSGRLPVSGSRPYILFVGGRHGYKNFAALLDIYAATPLLRDGFDLLCVGGGPLLPPEQDAIAKAGVTGSVRHETLDDDALFRRYRGASAFVYPSLYEGFGIPPLEAMAANCPVVAMATSSIPEVCGDAVEYALPGDAASLAAALAAVIGDTGRADALRAAGQARLARFSWQRCAAQTAERYRSLI